MDNDIPEWIKAGAPTIDKARELLGPSREEMYRALELYHTHVKHVMTIMFTLLTALIAVMGLSGKIDNKCFPIGVISQLVRGFLIVVFPLGVCAVFILLRYYQVYVSALIFAVRVHWAANLDSSHPWFVRTITQAWDWRKVTSYEQSLPEEGLLFWFVRVIRRVREWTKVTSDEQFLRRRALSLGDTFFLYALMILLLSGLSLFSAIWIL